MTITIISPVVNKNLYKTCTVANVSVFKIVFGLLLISRLYTFLSVLNGGYYIISNIWKILTKDISKGKLILWYCWVYIASIVIQSMPIYLKKTIEKYKNKQKWSNQSITISHQRFIPVSYLKNCGSFCQLTQ